MAQSSLKSVFHITIPEDFVTQAETCELIVQPKPSTMVKPTTLHLPTLPQLPNLNQRLVPRYHRPVPTSPALGVTRKLVDPRPAADPAVTQEVPALAVPMPTRSATPTQRRPAALRFCFQCGTPIAPWRDACGAHDRRQGRGLPPPPVLAPLHDAPPPDLSEAMTAIQPKVVLFPRSGT